MAPELIVIHNISLPPGEFGGDWIEALFTNRLDPAAHPYFTQVHRLRVSTHLLIRRSGVIIQFVPFHQRAWHAGKSNYCGRDQCNDFSIGIELEGTDDIDYESVQYKKLAEVIRALVAAYPSLSRDRIAGHEHIAPGRKTDPGPAFDWGRFRLLLA
jgi:AmpD protein